MFQLVFSSINIGLFCLFAIDLHDKKIQTQVEKVQLQPFPLAVVPINEASPFIWPSTVCVNTETVSEILENHVGEPRIFEKKITEYKRQKRR